MEPDGEFVSKKSIIKPKQSQNSQNPLNLKFDKSGPNKPGPEKPGSDKLVSDQPGSNKLGVERPGPQLNQPIIMRKDPPRGVLPDFKPPSIPKGGNESFNINPAQKPVDLQGKNAPINNNPLPKANNFPTMEPPVINKDPAKLPEKKMPDENQKITERGHQESRKIPAEVNLENNSNNKKAPKPVIPPEYIQQLEGSKRENPVNLKNMSKLLKIFSSCIDVKDFTKKDSNSAISKIINNEDIKNLKKEIETIEKFNPSKNFSIRTCQQFTINGSTKIQRILSTTHDIEDVLIPVYSYIES